MSSIRNKFFVQFGALVIFIIVILLVANNVLLEKYYIARNKTFIEEYYYEINELEEADYTFTNELFREIELTRNFNILIVDENNELLYSSRPEEASTLPPPNSGGDPNINPNDDFLITEGFVFEVIEDQNFNGETLTMRGILDNGNKIEFFVPVTAIQENIQYVNEFLLYVGLFGFVVSLIIAFFLANHIAKPIKKINKIAKKMKALDFTDLVDLKSKDELGELGESINDLASTLSKTIENLQDELSLNKKLSTKRRELLNNVSHELKTPLALIQGYSEGLSMNIHSSKEKTNYYCEVITEEAVNMNRIIEDLLEIEDVDSNFKVNITKNVDLNKYISKKINKHKINIKNKNLFLIEDYEQNLVADIDEYLMDRIMTNFIVNAINYCTNDGYIKVTTLSNIDKVRVSIFNSFEGFNEDEINKLWDSFYKVDQARTRDVGGHGLGLSIVKSIQDTLQEKYGVKNVDDGVEFWFEVPLSNN